jgi:hypothetical protein
MFNAFHRLLDILHYEAKLYLVFEFVDNDLKKYQEIMNAARTPLSIDTIKVLLGRRDFSPLPDTNRRNSPISYARD